MLLYLVILVGLGILLVASLGALREAIRQKARPRGFLIAIGLAVFSVVGFWAMLI